MEHNSRESPSFGVSVLFFPSPLTSLFLGERNKKKTLEELNFLQCYNSLLTEAIKKG